MTKHTASPWHHGGYEIQDDKGALICNLSGWRSEQQTLANARLIAAAPELLEALQAFDNAAKESTTIITFAGRSLKLLTQARAAIAKAEGDNNG